MFAEFTFKDAYISADEVSILVNIEKIETIKNVDGKALVHFTDSSVLLENPYFEVKAIIKEAFGRIR